MTRLLVFTSLWPNPEHPISGVFVRHRIAAVARIPGVSVHVVAPVPWFPDAPRWAPAPERWRMLGRVPRSEVQEGLVVDHPRYVVTPRVGMRWYGSWMTHCTASHVERLHRERPFDAVDAHFVYPDGHAAVQLGRRLGIPVVVSAWGSDINQYAKLPHIRPLLRRTCDQAAGVVAVSAELRDQIVDLGVDPDHVRAIPNGVMRRVFRPMPRAAARRKVGVEENVFAFVTVGALIQRKGIDTLIDAFAVLAAERPGQEFRLYCLGEGPDRAALEERIAERGVGGRVFLLGACPQEELAEWYSAADAFCLASLREGCPNVVIEAMACGAPVVATALGGVRELVTSDDLGRLVDVADRSPKSWAAALASAADATWDRAHIAARGGGRSWDQVAAEVVGMHEEIQSNAARRGRVLESACG